MSPCEQLSELPRLFSLIQRSICWRCEATVLSSFVSLSSVWLPTRAIISTLCLRRASSEGDKDVITCTWTWMWGWWNTVLEYVAADIYSSINRSSYFKGCLRYAATSRVCHIWVAWLRITACKLPFVHFFIFFTQFHLKKTEQFSCHPSQKPQGHL